MSIRPCETDQFGGEALGLIGIILCNRQRTEVVDEEGAYVCHKRKRNLNWDKCYT